MPNSRKIKPPSEKFTSPGYLSERQGALFYRFIEPAVIESHFPDKPLHIDAIDAGFMDWEDELNEGRPVRDEIGIRRGMGAARLIWESFDSIQAAEPNDDQIGLIKRMATAAALSHRNAELAMQLAPKLFTETFIRQLDSHEIKKEYGISVNSPGPLSGEFYWAYARMAEALGMEDFIGVSEDYLTPAQFTVMSRATEHLDTLIGDSPMPASFFTYHRPNMEAQLYEMAKRGDDCPKEVTSKLVVLRMLFDRLEDFRELGDIDPQHIQRFAEVAMSAAMASADREEALAIAEMMLDREFYDALNEKFPSTEKMLVPEGFYRAFFPWLGETTQERLKYYEQRSGIPYGQIVKEVAMLVMAAAGGAAFGEGGATLIQHSAPGQTQAAIAATAITVFAGFLGSAGAPIVRFFRDDEDDRDKGIESGAGFAVSGVSGILLALITGGIVQAVVGQPIVFPATVVGVTAGVLAGGKIFEKIYGEHEQHYLKALPAAAVSGTAAASATAFTVQHAPDILNKISANGTPAHAASLILALGAVYGVALARHTRETAVQVGKQVERHRQRREVLHEGNEIIGGHVAQLNARAPTLTQLWPETGDTTRQRRSKATPIEETDDQHHIR